MKKKFVLFSLVILTMVALIVLFAFLFGVTAEADTTPITPVRVSIRAIDKSFPLEPYPEYWMRDSFVDGPAFWRDQEGMSIEIVSHSVQDPGRYFRLIEVGDTITLEFSDNSTRYYVVDELILMKYKCPYRPYNVYECTWMIGDREFTRQSFSDFVFLRPGALILHTSLAKDGDLFSAGQRFYIAYPLGIAY